MALVAAPVLVHDARDDVRGTSEGYRETRVKSEAVEFDAAFVGRLRASDERAFRALVTALHGPLRRFARSFTHDDSIIEEALQETWLGVIRGIGAFEGRASLRTWIFGILANQARRLAVRARDRAQREGGAPADGSDDPLEGRFAADGHWREPPTAWDLRDPEAMFLTGEAQGVLQRSLDEMPEAQRQVVLLVDVEGLPPEEVCNILGITGTHQRVLLHRGRVRVRQALDAYVRGVPPAQPHSRRERSREP